MIRANAVNQNSKTKCVCVCVCVCMCVCVCVFFFYQNIYYNVETNNLQSTKINQNNMIKMSQTINITLQPMQ